MRYPRCKRVPRSPVLFLVTLRQTVLRAASLLRSIEGPAFSCTNAYLIKQTTIKFCLTMQHQIPPVYPKGKILDAAVLLQYIRPTSEPRRKLVYLAIKNLKRPWSHRPGYIGAEPRLDRVLGRGLDKPSPCYTNPTG